MSTTSLLEDLHQRDIHLRPAGLMLRVNAPKGAATGELRALLHEHKRNLIRHLERERRRLDVADRRGLIVKWAKEPGYLTIHDPTTGEWHELSAKNCPPWMLEDAKAHRRRRKEGR